MGEDSSSSESSEKNTKESGLVDSPPPEPAVVDLIFRKPKAKKIEESPPSPPPEPPEPSTTEEKKTNSPPQDPNEEANQPLPLTPAKSSSSSDDAPQNSAPTAQPDEEVPATKSPTANPPSRPRPTTAKAPQSSFSASTSRPATAPSPSPVPHDHDRSRTSRASSGYLRRRVDKLHQRAQEFTPSIFGGFSNPGYLNESSCPNLPRRKSTPTQRPTSSKFLLPPFHMKPCNDGSGPGAFFDTTYPTLASPDQNDEADRILAMHGLLSKRITSQGGQPDDSETVPARFRPPPPYRQLHPFDFRVASYPKKPTGKGSYVGCFQSKPYEYMPHSYTDEEIETLRRRQRRRSPPRLLQTRTVVTSPPKKGGCGFSGITFTPFVGLLSPDEKAQKIQEEAERKHRREMQRKVEESRQHQDERPPFKAVGGRSLNTFDEKPNTGVSGVYDSTFLSRTSSRHSQRRPTSATQSVNTTSPFSKRRQMSAEPQRPPFRPVSGIRSGHEGNLNPFPNSVLSEEELKRIEKREKLAARRAQRRMEEMRKHWAKDLPPWRAPPGPKSSVVPSLLPKNLRGAQQQNGFSSLFAIEGIGL